MAKKDISKSKKATPEITIFKYSTNHLKKKDLVRFYYALKGRDGQSGILKATSTEFLAKGVLLVKDKYKQELEDFFKFWGCSVRKWKVQNE